MKKLIALVIVIIIVMIAANPVARRDISDNIKYAVTGKTESQRDFEKSVSDIY